MPPGVPCLGCELNVTPPTPVDLSVRVGVQLDQSAVIARNAFKATLEMINPLPSVVSEIRAVIAVICGAAAQRLWAVESVCSSALEEMNKFLVDRLLCQKLIAGLFAERLKVAHRTRIGRNHLQNLTRCHVR